MTPFSWNNPYAWPRRPVLAENAVATSQPLAAQANEALEDLKAGRVLGRVVLDFESAAPA